MTERYCSAVPDLGYSASHADFQVLLALVVLSLWACPGVEVAADQPDGGALAAQGGGAGGSTGTGGSSATGGSTGTGGAIATGGSTGTGGAIATGGSTGTGGSIATGGSTGTGGAIATGGSTGTGGATTHFRDWAQHPAIVQLDTPDDVFAIGDVHADPARVEAVLVGAGLIPSVPATPAQVQWSGGHAVVVFMGDLIDKYTDSLGALTLVRTLETKAAAAGGRVIVLLGNHEAEFLADPTGTKTSDFASELTAAGQSPAAVAQGLTPLGVELRNRPLAARVNGFFFAHGGNPGALTLAQLDQALQAGLDAQGFAAPILMDPDSLLEARLSPAPWWETNGVVPSALGAGISHLVQGHQPGSVTFSDGSTRAAGEVYARLGLYFLVDSGMSRGVNKTTGASLRLHRTSAGATKAEKLTPSGVATLLWQG